MKNIFKGKLKFVILLLVLIFILFYYFTHRGKKEEVYVDEYSYMKVEQTDEIGTINLNGYVKANNPIGIFVDKKLKVKEVFIKNGDFVEKGQILMTFDDDETNKLNRSIEKERINLQKIQRDLNTTRELYKLGGASRDEVKNLEDSARISQLNIDEYVEVLSKTATEVRSPVDGVVSNLKAQENYLVDLRIIVEIPEYNTQTVKLGQSIRVRQDISDDDKVYDGEITKISRLSTTSSMTGENVLEADVKTNETIPNLVPGFKIKAVLQLKSDVKNIIIPKIALQNEEGKYFDFSKVEYSKIFLDKDNKWCIPRRPAEDYSKLNLLFYLSKYYNTANSTMEKCLKKYELFYNELVLEKGIENINKSCYLHQRDNEAKNLYSYINDFIL